MPLSNVNPNKCAYYLLPGKEWIVFSLAKYGHIKIPIFDPDMIGT